MGIDAAWQRRAPDPQSARMACARLGAARRRVRAGDAGRLMFRLVTDRRFKFLRLGYELLI